MSHLFQTLEADLKFYLENLGINVNSEVRNFLINRTKNIEDGPFDDPIANVYWLDLWELAASIEEDDNKKTILKKLLKYAGDETIRNARNSHGHGNKQFHKHYWYSVAAFANRPEIKFLGFERVQEAIKRVENGDLISEVVLDDVDNYQILTPNNLPIPDWENTGFIGRTNDLKKLEQELKNGRVNQLCISGPGGVGKTALALKVLNKLCFEAVFDEIYFYSFKSEFLSSGGIIKKDSSLNIETIKNDMFEYFENKYENVFQEVNNVCIFLDNIEDITVEDDSLFNTFLETLPASWKIIATSRLVPNGFKVIKIDDLDDGGCLNLARKYVKIYGSDEAITTFEMHKDTVIETCANNPLAIKLAIDLGRENHDFSKSATNAIRMVTEFSFKNLAENFDDQTIIVMEYLRQAGKSSASHIANTLNLPIDLIANKLSHIRNTSLIKVSQNLDDSVTIYENSDLTSNFLANAQNIDAQRSFVQDKIKNNIGLRSKVNDFNEKYFPGYFTFSVPEDAPLQSLDLLKKLNKIGIFSRKHNVKFRDYHELSHLMDAWNQLPASFRASAYFLRVRGSIYAALNDNRAIADYEEAIRLDDTENSFQAFANFYFKNGEWQEASNIYEKALTIHPNSNSLGLGYCITMTYTNTDINRQAAADFAQKKILAGNLEFETAFLNSISRLGENGFSQTPAEQIDMSLDLYQKIAQDIINKQIFTRFIDTLASAIYRYGTTVTSKIDVEKLIKCFLRFQSLGGSFRTIVNMSKTGLGFEDYIENIFGKIGASNLVDKFIADETISDSAYSTNSDIKERIKSGELILAKVDRIIEGRGFFFAKNMEEEFFCHITKLVKEFDGSEDLIAINSIIALSPTISKKGKEFRDAEEFYLVPLEWENKFNLKN